MEDPTCDPRNLVPPASSTEAFKALDHAHQQLIAAEIAELIMITHAADLWRIDDDAVSEGIERLMQPGHDGTPKVGEFLALEVGALLGMSPQSALFHIGDALDLRHRHPALWTAVLAGKVRVWQAMKICREAAHLSAAAVAELDKTVANGLSMMPLPRIMAALPGWITAADEDLARKRAAAQRQSRKVQVSRIEDGHVTIWGKVDPADGITFDRALTGIAKTLPTQPDPLFGSDLDRRRAAAVGILARQAFGQDALPSHTLVVHIDADDPVLSPAISTCENARAATENTGTPAPATGVARVEGWGSLLTERLPQFLAESNVIVKPILDPGQLQASDCYETPDRMRFAIEQRNRVQR